jgi:hypothetical protein
LPLIWVGILSPPFPSVEEVAEALGGLEGKVERKKSKDHRISYVGEIG